MFDKYVSRDLTPCGDMIRLAPELLGINGFFLDMFFFEDNFALTCLNLRIRLQLNCLLGWPLRCEI